MDHLDTSDAGHGKVKAEAVGENVGAIDCEVRFFDVARSIASGSHQHKRTSTSSQQLWR